MQGRKTGGRQAGTPNKRSTGAAEKLEQIGCDPLLEMARIAADAATPVPVRARLFAELAGYCWPKRKAIELAPAEDFVAPVIEVRFVGGSDEAD